MPTVLETIRKVKGFATLLEGWHFGEGLPPTQGRIDQAVAFLVYAQVVGIDRANAFPGINGQVEVTFYSADQMLEITVESDDSLTLAEDRGDEQIGLEENVSQRDVYQKLNEFDQNPWLSSDLFTVNITTQSAKVLVSQVARWTSEVENHFPLSKLSVPPIRVVHVAPTSLVTTTSRPVNLRFTGPYMVPRSPLPVELRSSEPLMVMSATGTFTIGDERVPAELLKA